MIEGAQEHQFLDGFVAPAEVSHVKYVQEVLNQKSCGSCWAFGTAASAEVNFNKATGKSLTFSPQQLLDCSGAGSCDGGIHPNAVKYYEKVVPALHSEYPYQGKQGSCLSKSSSQASKPKSTNYFLNGTPSQWMEAVALRAVTMSFRVASDFMRL